MIKTHQLQINLVARRMIYRARRKNKKEERERKKVRTKRIHTATRTMKMRMMRRAMLAMIELISLSR
jgi:hypothetical protein